MRSNILKRSFLLFIFLTLVSAVSADTFRYHGETGNGTGNWEDSFWQNQTAGLNDQAPPGAGDKTVMNYGGGTVTLNSVATVGQFLTGDNEEGHLLIAPGGHLTATGGWGSIAYNNIGSLTVETGGRMDFTGHLWAGMQSGSEGTVNLNGGTLAVANAFELGGHDFGGTTGQCTINVNNAGTLELKWINSGLKSIHEGSVINLQGTGKVTVNDGEKIARLQEYIDAGFIKGYDWGGNETGLVVDYDVTVPGRTVVMIANTLLFEADKASYDIGQDILFSWANQPGNDTDWIGIWPAGSAATDNTGLLGWAYTNGTDVGDSSVPTGNLLVDEAFLARKETAYPLAAGNYEAWFCLNDGYDKSGPAIAFTVTTPEPVLTVNKPTYYDGEDVTITWDWQTGNSTDYIGIWVKDSAATDATGLVGRGYVDGATGALTVDAAFMTAGGGTYPIAPGDYDVYYCLEDGFTKNGEKLSITVVGVGPVVNATDWDEVCAADPGPGGTVLLTAGTYFANIMCEAKDGVTYKGVGDGTIIDATDSTGYIMRWSGTSLDGKLESVKIINATERVLRANTSNPQYITVKNVNFLDCSGAGDGGVINYKMGVLDVIDCTFTNIVNRTGAGAIFAGNDAFNSILNFTRTTFTNCTLENSSKPGAAMYIPANTSTLNLTDCVFTGCDAPAASGAINIASRADLNITGCVFDTNSAGNDGGHMSINGASNITITDSEFLNGSARHGGQINITGTASVFITDSKFINGQASGQVGAIRMSNDGAVESHINNCLFVNNTAAEDFTTMQKGRVVVEAINNTYVNNTSSVGGGILRMVHFNDTSTPIIISNNLFLNNTIGGTAADTDGEPGIVSSWQTEGTSADDFTVTNNLFFGNTSPFDALVAGSNLDGKTSVIETGRVTDDPQLDAEYKPTAASTAVVDGGDAALATEADLDGTPAWATRDIGAYEYAPDGHLLTVNVTGNGTVELTPPGGAYVVGTVVTLTATPDAGNQFVAWGGDASGAELEITITMDSDKTVEATFAPITHTLTVTAENGTVAVSPEGTVFAEGTEITLTPTADEFFVFESWSGDATGSDNPLVITMGTADMTIVANFTDTRGYALDLSSTAGGSVLADPASTEPYPNGAVVTITPTAEAGFAFVGWTINDADGGADNPLLLTMDGAKVVVANFVALVNLDLSSTVGGSATPDSEGPYPLGSVVTITATADAGFAFTGWTGDDSTSNPLLLTMDGDKTIVANFAALYSLDLSSTDGGSAAADSEGPYVAGAVVTITPTAEEGFAFIGWTGDVESTDNPLLLTMDTPKAIVANFAPLYALDLTSTDGGSAMADSAGPYVEGTVVTITPTAEEGFTFTGWSGDDTSTDNPLLLTMDSAKTIVANFAPLRTLDLTSTAGGSAEADSEGPYAQGAVVTITATAEEGFAFDSWSGDDTSTDNPLLLTMDSDKTIVANFTALPGPNDYKITWKKSTLVKSELVNGQMSLALSGGTDKSSIKIQRLKKLPKNMTEKDGTTYVLGLRLVPELAITGAFGKITCDVEVAALTSDGAIKSITTKMANIAMINASSVGAIKMTALRDDATEVAQTAIFTGAGPDMKLTLSGAVLDSLDTLQNCKYIKLASKAWKDKATKVKYVSLGGATGDIVAAGAKSITAKGASIACDEIRVGQDITNLKAQSKKLNKIDYAATLGKPVGETLMTVLVPNIKTVFGTAAVNGVFIAGFDTSTSLPTYTGEIKSIGTKAGAPTGEAHVSATAKAIKFKPSQGDFQVLTSAPAAE